MPPPITRKEFAEKVKAKYTEYAAIDDNELVDKMVAKYPEYKEQISDYDTIPVKKNDAPVGSDGLAAGDTGGTANPASAAGVSVANGIDTRLPNLAPELYSKVQAARLNQTNATQTTPEDFTEVVPTTDGSTRKPSPAESSFANKNLERQTTAQAGDLKDAEGDVERFSQSLVARLGDDGKYVGVDGKEKTDFKDGDIVSVPNDKRYPGGFAQLTDGAWHGTSAPDPNFVAKTDELPGATVVGYRGKGWVANNLNKTDTDISQTDYDAALAKLDKYPKVAGITFDNQNFDGSKKQPFFLLQNPEILPVYEQVLTDRPTYNKSADGAYTALNNAVVKTYGLDKSPWGGDGPLVDSGEFERNVQAATKLQDLSKQGEDAYNMLQKAGPDAKPALAAKLQALQKQAAQYDPAQLQQYFARPEVAGIITKTQQQEKGYAVLSQLQKMFPKRAKQEDKLMFRQQNEQDPTFLQAYGNLNKSFLYGSKEGFVKFGNAVGNLVNGSDDNAVERASSEVNADMASQDFIPTYRDNATLNFANTLLHMTGEMAPTFLMSGGTGTAANIAGKAFNGLYFGLSSYDDIKQQYHAEGIPDSVANLAAGVGGGMMAFVGIGLPTGKAASLEGFKPSFATVESMLVPETRAAGEAAFRRELFSYRGGELLKSIPESGKAALEMKVAGSINAAINSLTNSSFGSNLNTETGSGEDFISTWLSFAVQNVGMKAITMKGYGPDERTALIHQAASDNISAVHTSLDAAAQEPLADVSAIQKAKDDLDRFAGISFPDKTTPAQRTGVYLLTEEKRLIQENQAQAPKFAASYEPRLRDIDKKIAELLTQPEVAAKEVDAAIKPVQEEIRRSISVLLPDAAGKTELPTITIGENESKIHGVNDIGAEEAGKQQPDRTVAEQSDKTSQTVREETAQSNNASRVDGAVAKLAPEPTAPVQAGEPEQISQPIELTPTVSEVQGVTKNDKAKSEVVKNKKRNDRADELIDIIGRDEETTEQRAEYEKIKKDRLDERKKMNFRRGQIEDEVHDAILSDDDGTVKMPDGYHATVVDSYYEPIVGQYHTIAKVVDLNGEEFYVNVNTKNSVDLGREYGKTVTNESEKGTTVSGDSGTETGDATAAATRQQGNEQEVDGGVQPAVQNETDGQPAKTIADFKNPNENYRVITGDAAYEDLVKTGVVRTNANDKGEKVEGAISLRGRPTLYPSFSRGEASVSYANENPNHYIIVSDDPSLQPSQAGRHGKGETIFPTSADGKTLSELSGDKVRVYKYLGDGKYELVYENGKEVNKTNEQNTTETTTEPVRQEVGATGTKVPKSTTSNEVNDDIQLGSVAEADTPAEPVVPPGTITFQYNDGKVRRGTITGTTEDGGLKVKGADGTNYRIAEDQVLARDGKQLREAKTFDNATPPPVEYKETAKKIADKVRKAANAIGNAKLGGEGATMLDITAVPRKVMQLALHGAAEIIEAGGKVADAISHVVDAVRTHLAATDEAVPARRDLTRSVSDYFKSLGLEEADSDTTIKQDIRNVTQTGGVAGEKVTMTPKQALKEQIRALSRGAAMGFKAGVEQTALSEKTRLAANKTVIETILKQAKDAGLFKGDVDGKLARKLAAEVLKLSNAHQMKKFGVKLGRILDDIEYDNKLTRAKELQSAVRKGVKSKSREMSAATADVLKDFANLDPSAVEDIDGYNAIAEQMVPTAKGLKVRASDGIATTKYENYEIANADVQAYVDKEQAAAEQRVKDEFEQTYASLVAAGAIDPATMSLSEMQDIVNTINGTDPNAAVSAAEKLANDDAKKKALQSVVDYNKQQLAGYDETNLTPLQKKVLAAVRDVDTAALTPTELVKVNAAINEIVVNDNFTGSGDIEIIHAKQVGMEQGRAALEKLGIKNFGSANEFEAAIASTHLLNEFVTKNTKGASELQRASGTFAIFNGHAQAKDIQMKALDEYQKLKAKGKGNDTADNHFRRGVLAAVANNFGGTPEEVQGGFNRMKGLIRQSADALLKSSDKDEQLMGAAYEKAYNELLNGSDDYAAVLAKSNALHASNATLVDFWRTKFQERHAATREDAEVYNNKSFESVDNYTSTQVRSLKARGAIKEVADPFAEVFVGKNLTKGPAGTKEAKSRSERLTPQTFIDLDFDVVQNKRYYETNYDVLNGRNIAYARLFFADPATDALFGGQKNKLLVRDALAKSVKNQIGTRGDTDYIGRLINRTISGAVGKGVRIALGSIFQAPKQTISVWGRAAVNMGGDMDLLLKSSVRFATDSKAANELMQPYSINIRGRGTQGGTMKDFDLRQDKSAALTTAKEVGETVGKYAGKLHDGIMYALTKSDEAVAKTTWLAFYAKSLREQGLPTDISYSEMAANRNDEAAAYAEQMVSRTQVPNDPTAMGNFYKDKNAWKNLAKQYALPFSSFSTNQRVSMTNDMQKIMFGTGKAEAVRSLAGTAVESALFNTLKVYFVGALVKGAANGILTSFGYRNKNDEEYEENTADRTIAMDGSKDGVTVSADAKKAAAGAVSDYFFSGMGSAIQNGSSYGMNLLYNNLFDEYGKNGKALSERQTAPFFIGSEQNKLPDWASVLSGTLAPLADQSMQAISNAKMLDGKTEKVVGKGNTKEVEITDDEKTLHEISFAINLLTLVGVSDAEITHANTQMKREMDKKEKTKYGGKSTVEVQSKGKGHY